jgi:hypothetical protein
MVLIVLARAVLRKVVGQSHIVTADGVHHPQPSCLYVQIDNNNARTS